MRRSLIGYLQCSEIILLGGSSGSFIGNSVCCEYVTYSRAGGECTVGMLDIHKMFRGMSS